MTYVALVKGCRPEADGKREWGLWGYYSKAIDRPPQGTPENVQRSAIVEMRSEVSTCAWCGKALEAHETAWLVRARTVGDLPEHEGGFATFKLAKSGRTVTGFLVTSDSLAKQEGTDVAFAVCGREECILALKAAVREEADALGLVII